MLPPKEFLMACREIAKQTITIAAAGTSGSFTWPFGGAGIRHGARALYGVLIVPDWTNLETLTLVITDADTLTLYSKAAIAENATYYLRREDTSSWGGNTRTFDIPLIGIVTFTFTLTGVPGGTGGNITFKLWYDDGVNP